jgi:hypothetical protein
MNVCGAGIHISSNMLPQETQIKIKDVRSQTFVWLICCGFILSAIDCKVKM